MSFFKKIIRGAGKLVGRAAGLVPGPIGTIARVVGAGGALAGSAGALTKSLPAVRSLPGIGTVMAGGAGKVLGPMSRIGGKVLTGAGVAATGVAIYDAAGNYLGMRKRKRRINPLNGRALSRALRRVEKVKSTMKRVNAITIRKAKDC